ncbi:MAG: HAD hydrolase family protein [Desulfobacteraceae bacterium]|nr:HAD hydrolase family protein [Desulfobacteraceae bacterium]
MILNRQTIAEVLSVDLDGTLLHSEPEAIAVWGRSGYRYMSSKAAEFLIRISRQIPIVIATGRNAQSVRRLTEQIPELRCYGFVLENGFVIKTELDSKLSVHSRWDEIAGYFPDWERLGGYENCLGLIPPPSAENPEKRISQVLADTGQQGFLYRENHKIFIYPFMPSKLSGCRALGVFPLIAIGDEVNDADILEAAEYAGTLSSAHNSVKQIVLKKQGYCSPLSSHAAAEDLLQWVERTLERL